MKYIILFAAFFILSECGNSSPIAESDEVIEDKVVIDYKSDKFDKSEEKLVTPKAEELPSSTEEVRVEHNSADTNVVLSDHIDSANKLLVDLDAHVQTFLPSPESAAAAAEEVAPTTEEPSIYSGELELTGRQAEVNSLLDQLDVLDKRITDTINQLTARRRYVIAAMLRPMATYVRRVRSNLERLQNRLNALTSAATSSTAAQNPAGGVAGAASTVVDQGVIDNLRRRIEDIQKRIGEIVSRVSSTFSLPGAAAPSTPSPGR